MLTLNQEIINFVIGKFSWCCWNRLHEPRDIISDVCWQYGGLFLAERFKDEWTSLVSNLDEGEFLWGNIHDVIIPLFNQKEKVGQVDDVLKNLWFIWLGRICHEALSRYLWVKRGSHTDFSTFDMDKNDAYSFLGIRVFKEIPDKLGFPPGCRECMPKDVFMRDKAPLLVKHYEWCRVNARC